MFTAQRVAVDTQLLADAPARRCDVARLLLDVENQADRPLPQLIRILPWCWHDSILWLIRSLHETRGDSFPRGLVDEVIGAAGAREQRRRVLPAWLTLYFVLALALFMDRGALRVMRKLAGVVAWAGRGVVVRVPSEEALSNARARLGSEPLRLLFEQVAGFTALDRPGFD
jgi:hypothetical protein